MAWIESEPLWLIGLVIVALLMAAHELGLWLVRRIKLQGEGEERGYVVSSALALLGLITAFTFSAAQERFLHRQELVMAEANAIGTTYLRYQIIDPAARGDLSALLLRYTELRVAHERAATPAEAAAGADREAELQARIWTSLARAVRVSSVPTLNFTLVQATNDTFDLAAARRAADEQRLPVTIVRVLVASALVVAFIVGYSGGGRRDVGVFAGSTLLLALAFCLILDLDRPVSGSVQIRQAPMERALQSIRQGEAAKPPAAPSP